MSPNVRIVSQLPSSIYEENLMMNRHYIDSLTYKFEINQPCPPPKGSPEDEKKCNIIF